MDPVGPFIEYFLDRDQVEIAVGLAVLVVLVLLGGAWLGMRRRQRAQRRNRGERQAPPSRAMGAVQTTTVENVRSEGDVTVSPRQRNG